MPERPWRVLVTGYDQWLDPEFAEEQFKQRLALHGALVIIHGGGPKGPDLVAADYVRRASRAGLPVTEDVYRKDVRKYGREPDPERDLAMVESGVDEALVFIQTNKSSKTRPMYAVQPGLIKLLDDDDTPIIKFQHSRRAGHGRQVEGTRYCRRRNNPAYRGGQAAGSK
jgi:hypothetical protein